MAKNQVTLTFAGESKDLQKAMDAVGSSSRELEQNIDRSVDAASRLDRALGDGGRRFGDYGTGLGGVGDRADEVDTRMMGLSDGIQGVTDLMGGNGKLAPHEMAMAFSDLGSATYNTVIPSLQSAVKAVKGMNLASAGLVVGIAAVTAGAIYWAHQQSKTKINTEELTEALRSQDAAVESSLQEFLRGAVAFDELDAAFAKVLETSPELADEFIEQAEAVGVSEAELDEMRAQLDNVAVAQANVTDEIRAMSDALQAQFDPLFGVTDAARSHADAQLAVAEAQAAVNAAIAEYGEGSPEHLAAVAGLTAANAAAVGATADLTSAQFALAEGIAAGDVKLADAQGQLAAWVEQGLITQQQADEMAWAFAVAASQADTLATDRGFNIWVNESVSDTVDRINEKLGELHDKTLTIRANVVSTGPGGSGGIPIGAASGGIVPDYFAAGGIGGPRGTDTIPAWLTPGEMVLNKSQQQEMFRLLDAGMSGGRPAGGDTTVNVYVQGSIRSDRDLVKIIRDEIARGGFGGAFA